MGMKNLNENNYQMKGDDQMGIIINNFWERMSEMNDIHMELWENRHIAAQDEPDAGTLEILANCDEIESILAEKESQMANDNQDQYENLIAMVDAYIDEDDAEEARYEMEHAQDLLLLGMLRIDVIEDEVSTEYEYQLEDEQFILEMELERELMAIEMASQSEWYECGIINIQEYLALDNGSQIEYGDDMDEIDIRNVENFLAARLVA